MRTVDYFYAEADGTLANHLTQFYKQGHDTGWNKAIKSAAITIGPSLRLGKEQVEYVREKILRLLK